MVKSILKEIIILLLLCVAIILVLGVIFYEDIPSTKVLPSKVEAYKTPNSIAEEINTEVNGLEKINIVYEVTDSDLNIYKSSKSYVPGKVDPFSDDISENVSTTTNNNNANNSSNNNNTNNNSNISANSNSEDNNTSEEHFYNSTGTK